MSDKEKKVFSQELDRDDLKATTGGKTDGWSCDATQYANCINENDRPMYGGRGFPNCASSVEDGSDCDDADACFGWSVKYQGMKGCLASDCHRSWR